MYFLQLGQVSSVCLLKSPRCTPSSAPVVKPSFSRNSPISQRLPMGTSDLEQVVAAAPEDAAATTAAVACWGRWAMAVSEWDPGNIHP